MRNYFIWFVVFICNLTLIGEKVQYIQDNAVVVRRIRTIDKNIEQATERFFYRLLITEVGGEEDLDRILTALADPEVASSFHYFYNPQEDILFITGTIDYYTISAFVFLDTNDDSTPEVIINISNELLSQREKFLERDIFLPLPLGYRIDLRSRSIWKITEKSFARHLLGPIVSSRLGYQIVERNPILRYLFFESRKLESFALFPEVYIYTEDGEGAQYIRLENHSLGEKAEMVLGNLSYQGFLNLLPLIIAHESWHYLYHHEFEHRDLNPLFAGYLNGEISDNQALEEYFHTIHPAVITYFKSKSEKINYNFLANEGIAYLFGMFVFQMRPGNRKYRRVEIKTQDVEIFADLGLIPDWMRPSHLGYFQEQIGEDYYQLIENRGVIREEDGKK